MKTIELKDARDTSLSLTGPVEFLAKNTGNQPGNNFKIEAYNGEPVDRWWGTLCIDVSGIKAAKNIPVLLDHIRSQIVGHSTRTYKDGSFFVEGAFSQTTTEAARVKGLAAEGFPWQASIGVRPVKIVSLEKDGKMQVNGKTIKGPAEIWTESRVGEASFVTFGADSNTGVSTFSSGKDAGENFMTVVDGYQKAHGCTRTEALKAVVKARPLLHQAYLDAVNQRQPPERSFDRSTSRPAGGETFMSLVDTWQKTHGSTRTAALTAIAGRHPEAHQLYLDEANRREARTN